MVSPLESTCCSMIRAKRRRRKTPEWIRNSNLKYLLRKPHEISVLDLYITIHCISRKLTQTIRIYLLQRHAFELFLNWKRKTSSRTMALRNSLTLLTKHHQSLYRFSPSVVRTGSHFESSSFSSLKSQVLAFSVKT